MTSSPSGVQGAIGVPADEAAAETPGTSRSKSGDDDWATVSRRKQKRVWKPLTFAENVDKKIEKLAQDANRFEVLCPKLEMPASEHDSDEDSDMLEDLECDIPEEDLERVFGPSYAAPVPAKPSMKFLNMLGRSDSKARTSTPWGRWLADGKR